MKNRINLIAAGSLCLAGFANALAATVNIPVNTVEDLIETLKTNRSSSVVVELAAGDYQLTDETAWMGKKDNGTDDSSPGKSHLFAAYVRIKGMGATPDETRLIGAGTQYRVLRLFNAVIENLTVTNGYAKVQTGASEGNRGGGIYGGTVTNCLITGCVADSVGGGAQCGVKIWNSRVINNKASGGGGFHNGSAYDTLFMGNVATGDGGGCYTSAKLVNCTFIGNTCESNGGGAYSVTYATNCVFAGNRAKRGGGGIGSGNKDASTIRHNYHFWNCIVTNNSTQGAIYGGGGAYVATLHNCLVANNWVEGNGGGGASVCVLEGCTITNNATWKGGGGGASACLLTNCLVYANTCSNATDHVYGGGILGGEAIDCEITGNCAWQSQIRNAAGNVTNTWIGTGGGAASCVLRNCRIHDNYAEGYGGGLRNATAYGCRIYNNTFGGSSDGQNAASCNLVGCDISVCDVSGGTALNSVFHGIDSAYTDLCLTNNPYRCNETYSCGDVWNHYPNATNCLFYDNITLKGHLFSGVDNASTDASFVNCTFANNQALYTFGYFKTAAHLLRVVNCVFVDNTTYNGETPQDVKFHPTSCAAEGVQLSYCLYGASPHDATDYLGDAHIWKLGEGGVDTSAGFRGAARSPDHPYALRARSTLRGKGLKMDWMTDATDIRGTARLTADTVDLGCYQYLANEDGLILLVR